MSALTIGQYFTVIHIYNCTPTYYRGKIHDFQLVQIKEIKVHKQFIWRTLFWRCQIYLTKSPFKCGRFYYNNLAASKFSVVCCVNVCRCRRCVMSVNHHQARSCRGRRARAHMMATSLTTPVASGAQSRAPACPPDRNGGAFIGISSIDIN